MDHLVIAAVLICLTAPAGAVAQSTRRASALPAPPGSREIRAHDPSTVLKQGKEYWFFCTGPGVRSYRSHDLLHWQPGPRTLDQLPQWTRQYPLRDDRVWAPDVVRAGDGQYFLYYSVSTFGKNASAIGMASSATLDPADPAYRWVDRGVVIASTARDDFNAIDPAVMLDADGRMWMSFGSFWSGIKLIELDPHTGLRVGPRSPMYALAHAKEIEAAFIYHRVGGAYYLFVNHGLCCRGVKSTYEIRVGRSERITGPYLDRDGKDLRDGGGTLVLGSDPKTNFIGPGHAGIVADAQSREWLSCHFYDATQGGRGTFALRRLAWTADGWPTIASDNGGQ
jgi:arabinan endo-1,5-alpha-L-arabinosidase